MAELFENLVILRRFDGSMIYFVCASKYSVKTLIMNYLCK